MNFIWICHGCVSVFVARTTSIQTIAIFYWDWHSKFTSLMILFVHNRIVTFKLFSSIHINKINSCWSNEVKSTFIFISLVDLNSIIKHIYSKTLTFHILLKFLRIFTLKSFNWIENTIRSLTISRLMTVNIKVIRKERQHVTVTLCWLLIFRF